MDRRLLGWGLIAYGVAGLGLLVLGALIGLDAATRIERLAAEADGTIAAAARSTEAAASSFTSIDGSLSRAQDSADAAASLALDASSTLDRLASAMELSVFGAQPLLPLAGEFEASAREAEALAGTLDGVADSLGETRPDVASIGTELEVLSGELELLRATDEEGGSPPLRLFVALLLAWLLIPALGALIGGVSLVRSGRLLRPPP